MGHPGVVIGMARLDPDFVEEGRRFVRQSDLEGLMNWVDRSGTLIDQKATRKTFELCFRAEDNIKAMHLFNAVFPKSNPTLEKAILFGKLVLIGLVLCGLIAGLVALIKAMS
jgi:hypothetical protein